MVPDNNSTVVSESIEAAVLLEDVKEQLAYSTELDIDADMKLDFIGLLEFLTTEPDKEDIHNYLNQYVSDISDSLPGH